MRRDKGFTMIEVILVLILVGILASFAGLGIVTGVQGYLLSRDSAVISEKAQSALTRVQRELTECYTCAGTAGTNVTMPFFNTLGPRTIRLSGGLLQVSSDGVNFNTLTDRVSTFAMTYNTDKTIQVNFTLTTPGGNVLNASTRVFPRNSAF